MPLLFSLPMASVGMYMELIFLFEFLPSEFMKHRSGLLKVNFDPALVRLLREAKGDVFCFHTAFCFF